MHMANRNMREIYFSLNITPEQYLKYYQGTAKSIMIISETGIRVKFPAGAIQKHITKNGIKGNFVIRYNSENKLIGVEKL